MKTVIKIAAHSLLFYFLLVTLVQCSKATYWREVYHNDNILIEELVEKTADGITSLNSWRVEGKPMTYEEMAYAYYIMNANEVNKKLKSLKLRKDNIYVYEGYTIVIDNPIMIYGDKAPTIKYDLVSDLIFPVWR